MSVETRSDHQKVKSVYKIVHTMVVVAVASAGQGSNTRLTIRNFASPTPLDLYITLEG